MSEGMNLVVSKIAGSVGDTVRFDKVLLLSSEGKAQFGTPFVPEVYAEGKILSQDKGEKIRVSKFKAKVHYRRTTGHRDYRTKVSIGRIISKSRKTEESELSKPKRTTRTPKKT